MTFDTSSDTVYTLYVYTVYTRETAHIPVNVCTWTIMDLCELKEVQNKKLGHDLGVKTPPTGSQFRQRVKIPFLRFLALRRALFWPVYGKMAFNKKMFRKQKNILFLGALWPTTS